MDLTPKIKDRKKKKRKKNLNESAKRGKHSVKTGVNSINHASGRTGGANDSYHETFQKHDSRIIIITMCTYLLRSRPFLRTCILSLIK